MLTTDDKKQLARKGITEEQLNTQLRQLREGFPFLRLRAAAAIGAGIMAPADAEQQAYVEAWQQYKSSGRHITKFVPASGAASRMFKAMFEFRDGDHDAPVTDFERTFFDRLHDFAFFPALDDACEVLYGMGADALTAAGRYRDVVSAMLDEEGLNYGQLSSPPTPTWCSSTPMPTPHARPSRSTSSRRRCMPAATAVPTCISPCRPSTAHSSRRWWSACSPTTRRASASSTT